MSLNDSFATKTNFEVLAAEEYDASENGLDFQVFAETGVVRDEDGEILNASSYVRTSSGIYYTCYNYKTAKLVAAKLAENPGWRPTRDDCCPDDERWSL